MRQLARILGEFLTWVVIALMVGLTTVVVAAVIYRKMGASLSWYDEIAGVLLAWITYYGAALAALKRSHIGFDDVLLSLPPSARKVAMLFAEGLVLLFFVLLAWSGLEVLNILEGLMKFDGYIIVHDQVSSEELFICILSDSKVSSAALGQTA